MLNEIYLNLQEGDEAFADCKAVRDTLEAQINYEKGLSVTEHEERLDIYDTHAYEREKQGFRNGVKFVVKILMECGG